MRQQKDRLHETQLNKYGRLMKIIEYNDSTNLVVEFEDGYTEKTRYDCFKRGAVLHPLDKFVLGIGYKGEGKYKITENNQQTFLYTEWHSMLARCYNPSQQKRDKTSSYEHCEVCEEWHNFQNFAKWYEDNYYEIRGEKMRLDKDILNKNNKVYSPENCVIVPERINLLFCYRKKNRGECPVGVRKRKECKSSYRATINITNSQGQSRSIALGSYKTPEEAFYAYKQAKEQHIKLVAEEYKDKIPKKLYDAMHRYVVEIND